MIGDTIEKVTKAVGVKPCPDCKERKELLNAWSRRGFFRRAATGAVAFTLGAKTLKAQQAVAHDEKAVRVLRFLNTALEWHRQEVGRYVNLVELMSSSSVHELKNHPAAEDRGIGNTLISSLDVHGSDIIPGWELGFKLSRDGQKYSAVIKTVGNSSFTFTTNEEGVIETGQPLMIRGGVLGRLFAAAFRCIGPIGEPGCCCMYPCCDQCVCASNTTCQQCHCCFNCGCSCCVWCETSC